jgi:hypothetical protein
VKNHHRGFGRRSPRCGGFVDGVKPRKERSRARRKSRARGIQGQTELSCLPALLAMVASNAEQGDRSGRWERPSCRPRKLAC